MRKRKLYLDTCILISFYYKKDRMHKRVIDFFKVTGGLKDIKLCISDFCLTEFTSAYPDQNGVSEAKISNITNKISRTKKIGKDYPITILDCEGNMKHYKFADFFVDVQSILVSHKPKPHLADAIHLAIMRNNRIKRIVTNDANGFKSIKNLIIIPTEEGWEKEIK